MYRRLGLVVLLSVGASPLAAQDVTFFFTADPQYNLSDAPPEEVASRNQRAVIAEMNTLPGTLDPFGEPVPEPRAVLVAGDLTQNGWWKLSNRLVPIQVSAGELNLFHQQWGLTGHDGELRYPVLEGYGNHDNDPDTTEYLWRLNYCYDIACFPARRETQQCGLVLFSTLPERPCTPRYGCDVGPFELPSNERKCWTPSADSVAWRSPYRVILQDGRNVGLTSSSSEGHYSWDWDGVHFVNLNEHAGGTADGPRKIYARNSLQFLIGDLGAHVAKSGRPIIIMQHFGFDGFSVDGDWWSSAEREALWEAIQEYHVVAFFTGHLHTSWLHSTFHGIDAFTSGGARDQPGFLVVRILGQEMRVMERRLFADGWRFGNVAVVDLSSP